MFLEQWDRSLQSGFGIYRVFAVDMAIGDPDIIYGYYQWTI